MAMWCVQAITEGIDKVLIEAGFDWREPGCRYVHFFLCMQYFAYPCEIPRVRVNSLLITKPRSCSYI
jgi:hypothetical protein